MIWAVPCSVVARAAVQNALVANCTRPWLDNVAVFGDDVSGALGRSLFCVPPILAPVRRSGAPSNLTLRVLYPPSLARSLVLRACCLPAIAISLGCSHITHLAPPEFPLDRPNLLPLSSSSFFLPLPVRHWLVAHGIPSAVLTHRGRMHRLL